MILMGNSLRFPNSPPNAPQPVSFNLPLFSSLYFRLTKCNIGHNQLCASQLFVCHFLHRVNIMKVWVKSGREMFILCWTFIDYSHSSSFFKSLVTHLFIIYCLIMVYYHVWLKFNTSYTTKSMGLHSFSQPLILSNNYRKNVLLAFGLSLSVF